MEIVFTTYPHSTIGEHLVPFDLVFKRGNTVTSVIEKIRKMGRLLEQSESIFVVDSNKKLVGKVEFRKLVAANQSQKLEEIMDKNFFVASAHSHQKTVAGVALKKGAESIPVVDDKKKFLGVINANEILKILHEEHVGELMKFSGILASEDFLDVLKTKLTKNVKARLPWLILGLFGGILATIIVEQFELALEKEITLAFFIPIIVYINDAVATQSETIFVRLVSVEKVAIKKYLINEIKVAGVIGLALSLIISLFTILWFHSITLAVIISVSMFLGVLSCVVIGTLVPWALYKLGKDPAIGSGPFTTILQDLISIVIYFSIATKLI